MTEEQKIQNIWEICLDLAIDSYNNGSMGISAVTTTSSFEILSTGRNYLYENTKDTSIISNSAISHAEINAIHALGQGGMKMRDLVLFTTVEPCPMCIGAIGMSRISKLLIGSRDPYAGSVVELSTNPYLKRKNIEHYFVEGNYEDYFCAVHYLGAKRALSDRPGHKFFHSFVHCYGEVTGRIENGVKSGLLMVDELNKTNLKNFLDQEKKNVSSTSKCND